MKAILPFRYELRMKFDNAGFEDVRVACASVEIEVPVVEPDDAPVVASWRVRTPDFGDAKAWREASARYGNGQFYTRASPDGATQVFTASTVGNPGRNAFMASQGKAFLDYLSSGYDSSARSDNAALLKLVDTRHVGAWDGVNRRGRRIAGVYVQEDNSTLNHAAMMEKASDLVVIGDEYWRRTSEPKLRMDVTGVATCAVSVELGDGISGEMAAMHPDVSRLYRLTDIADLAADMRREGQEARLHDIASVRVADPALFRFDRVANACLRVLREALAIYVAGVGNMSATAADDFVSLRDAVERLARGTSEGVDLADVAETVRRLLYGHPHGVARLLLSDLPEFLEGLSVSANLPTETGNVRVEDRPVQSITAARREG